MNVRPTPPVVPWTIFAKSYEMRYRITWLVENYDLVVVVGWSIPKDLGIVLTPATPA